MIFNVKFSVVKQFEAESKDDAWQELKTFCEDNDCHMLQDTIIEKEKDDKGNDQS